VDRGPSGVTVSPDGRRAYVVYGGITAPGDTISVIDTRTARVTTVDVGVGPDGAAVSADSNTVYVVNDGSDTVSVIDARKIGWNGVAG
jgi:YVTN family beta-propeller protein